MKKICLVFITLALALVIGAGGFLPVYAQDEFTLEEITVTAEKKEASLQDVPMSMTVVQGVDVINKSMESINDLLKEIPNVVTTAMGTGFTITMRGLGQDLPPGVGEASVATNIDGTHQSNPDSTMFGFFDVDRVEVLRGPQGTLYGRNATGGVINIISTKPKIGVTEGYASLNVGDYGLLKGESAINVPVSDKWAVRMGFLANKSDAYTKDSEGWRATRYGVGARGQFRYQPSDDVSVNFMINATKSEGTRQQTKISLENWEAGNREINDSVVPWNRLGLNNNEQYKLQINAEFPLGPGVVTFIPSYDHIDSRSISVLYDRDTEEYQGLRYGGRYDYETSTAELRYASKSDARVQWVAGLYYTEEDKPGAPRAPLPSEFEYSKAQAAFGQVTYPFSDSFRGVVGARVNKDEKGYENILDFDPQYPQEDSFSFTYFDWKVGVEWDYSENIMHYLTVATGHRPGGYNGMTSGRPFDEESLLSAEVGMKSRFMNNRLQVNGDIFWYSYKDYQAVDVWFEWDDDLGEQVMMNNFFNVDKAIVYGSEIEASAIFGESTMLDVSATYLKNEYKSDFIIHQKPHLPTAANMKGNTFPQSPEFTFSASIDHTFQFASGDRLKPRVSYRWTDEKYLELFISPDALWPSYSIVDASLTYYSTHNWTLNVYANNALDKDYATAIRSGEGIFPGVPRTIGCVLNVRF